MFDNYYLISYFSAGVMFTLSVLLATYRLPKDSAWHKFRVIQRLLAVACLLLFFSDMMEPSMQEDESNIGPLLIAIIAPFQALLFTATALVMILPERVNRRWTISNFVLLVVCGLGLVGLCHFFPNFALYFIHTMGLGYLLLVVYYTLYYLRARRETLRHLSEFYDDEMSGRLRWTDYFFFSALMMGFVALVCLYGPYKKLEYIFTTIMTAYYIYAVVLYLRYPITERFLVKAMLHYEEHATTPCCSEVSENETTRTECYSEAEIAETDAKIQLWVQSGRCFEPDLSVEEIIAEIGVSREQFDHYFSDHLQTQFRTWRIDIRMQQAVRLLHDNPRISTTQLLESIGYNDRSNFYKHFTQTTGHSFTTYRAMLSAS